MFDLLFKQIHNLNVYTSLLEDCQWDEERADKLIGYLYSSMEKISIDGAVSKEDLIKKLRSSLEDKIDEPEIDSLVGLVRNVMRETNLSSGKMDTYEN